MVAVFSEFENDIRNERTIDGMNRAKEKGFRIIYQPKLLRHFTAELEEVKLK